LSFKPTRFAHEILMAPLAILAPFASLIVTRSCFLIHRQISWLNYVFASFTTSRFGAREVAKVATKIKTINRRI
jgi:hypothetical protein